MLYALSKKKALFFGITALIIISSLLTYGISASAETDYRALAEERKLAPVATNLIENWPSGPAIGADSAILMEINTGAILYAKNIDTRLYPASTTKIFTALIAAENADMNETVQISYDAVHCYNWREDSNAGLKENVEISMEQALYAVLVGSANDAAFAVGEHISGSTEAFSELMNQKAVELGCKNTHFVNANGMHDDDHYTSAYDLAMIATAFFKNELLCKMSSTPAYTIPEPVNQGEDVTVNSKNKLLPGKQYAYEYLVGSKTGYTSKSRQVLVSCAEKDGLKLVCVIMNEESPAQFTDTVDLFNYGFSSFYKCNVYENETKYSIESTDFFNTASDVFGSSKPIISLNRTDYVVLPNTAVFADTVSSLAYDYIEDATVAKIDYSYNNAYVGSASVDLAIEGASFSFEDDPFAIPPVAETPEEKNVIFVNVVKVLLWIIGVAGFIIFLFVIRALINTYYFDRKRRYRNRHKKRKRERSPFDRYRF